MKKIFFSFSLVFIALSVNAQIAVTLQHNGTTQVFYGAQPFINAYNAAVSGDTIHLPGFNFSVAQPPIINKQIAIFGTGHYPDSTQATGATIIGGFTLADGADKSQFEGLTINGSITFAYDEKIDSVLIRRNRIDGAVLITGPTYANASVGILLNGNVLQSINCEHANAAIIDHNIFNSTYSIQSISNTKLNTHILNNIFLVGYASNAISNAEFVLFENNVFLSVGPYNGLLSGVYYSTFRNNTFWNDPTGDTYNTFIGNYVNHNIEIFTNVTSGFDYSQNYHLLNPLTYLGFDGTQVGIYGGASPYKEGAVPFNPHVIYKTIAPQTTPAGDLNINIKVGAQNE